MRYQIDYFRIGKKRIKIGMNIFDNFKSIVNDTELPPGDVLEGSDGVNSSPATVVPEAGRPKKKTSPEEQPGKGLEPSEGGETGPPDAGREEIVDFPDPKVQESPSVEERKASPPEAPPKVAPSTPPRRKSPTDKNSLVYPNRRKDEENTPP